MFSKILILTSLSLALQAFGAPSGSLASLSVAVTPAATKVRSIDDVKLSVVVSNPTNSDIRVVKYSNVLDDQRSRAFVVTKDGKDVTFLGFKFYVDTTNEDVYTTIPARSSLTVNHTLTTLYDFQSAGSGTFSFAPVTQFQLANDVIEAPSGAVQIEVTDDVARRDAPNRPNPSTSTPRCANAKKNQFIADALREARDIATGAANDIAKNPNSAQYRAYFGNNKPDVPRRNFGIIGADGKEAGDHSLYCHDDAGGSCKRPGVIAVTEGNKPRDIYFCDPFFSGAFLPTNAVCTGTPFGRTRGNVMIHELSHADVFTLDTVYGCDGSRALSDAAKVKNADNYACMALQIKKDHACR